MNKKYQEWDELTDRSCDALVLAYNPEQILGRVFGRNFYIPGCGDVEEAFGAVLRKIFGIKERSTHWADSVKWYTIKHLDKLEKRIRKGTGEVIRGNSDYQTIFEGYLSDSFGRFDSTWIYLKGDLHRFADGKRDEAIEQFYKFWNPKEKQRWTQIHKFMREYTKKQFKKKED